MKCEIFNFIVRYLKRRELDKMKNVKNFLTKYIVEGNSYNMLRISSPKEIQERQNWYLYKNFDYEWSKSLFASLCISFFLKSYHKYATIAFSYTDNELLFFSFCDISEKIEKLYLNTKNTTDKSFEWISNFKNLKSVTFKGTAVSNEMLVKLSKMKTPKIETFIIIDLSTINNETLEEIGNNGAKYYVLKR